MYVGSIAVPLENLVDPAVYVTPAGSWSATITFVAVPEPIFLTISLYVIASPVIYHATFHTTDFTIDTSGITGLMMVVQVAEHSDHGLPFCVPRSHCSPLFIEFVVPFQMLYPYASVFATHAGNALPLSTIPSPHQET